MEIGAIPQGARFAVYLVPPPEHGLTHRAAAWLGRNPWTGKPVTQPDSSGIAPDLMRRATESARGYGFHATVVAPFELADGQDVAALRQVLAGLAAGEAAVPLGLRVSMLSRFMALLAQDQATIAALQRRTLDATAPFRAPLSDYDRGRRLRQAMSERQRQNLERWGYPYVCEDFIFHMTLSGRLSEREAPLFLSAAQAWFGEALAGPVQGFGLGLFRQEDRQSSFVGDSFYAFGQP